MRHASRAQLTHVLAGTRDSTLRVFDSLGSPDAPRHAVPLLDELNPPLWELGHLAWFQEYWCVRGAEGPDGAPRPSMLANADAWFDSSRVPHDSRWTLPLPPARQLRQYLLDVLDASLECLLQADDDDAGLYPHRLALFHEQMHLEAFAQAWQMLGWPAALPGWRAPAAVRATGDVAFDACTQMLGSRPDDGFVFDNEKWAHPVSVEPYRIGRALVTNAEFAAFVDDGGYAEPRWWAPAAFEALRRQHRTRPRYWDDVGRMHWFGEWRERDPAAPVIHVDAFEAEAWCRWAGRRLPSEAQWEFGADGFDWGGAVWEWTSDRFEPFPGFSPDRYRDYSQPWFGTRRTLRGSSVATPPGFATARYRNFHLPHRNDIFAGFRSCAIEPVAGSANR
jgi:gamma-glutamyl hercynylcysteine S-oxide synthase